MKRVMLPLIALAMLAAPRAAAAQADAAPGQPQPDVGLAPGTIVVRVLDGSPTKPLHGTVVTLRTKDSERTARADTDGRATFANLPPGSTWVASVPVEDGEPATSQPIAVPAKGGMRVLLSPSPWSPGAVPPIAVPASGEQDKRPPPQDMASRPRGVQEIPPGSLQVRVVGGAWDKMIDKATVHLVGLRADGGIIYKKEQTNAAGLITFSSLRGRDVAYYVLTTLQRGELDDRLMSVPVSLLPQVGMAMVLSGEVEGDSKARDDLSNFYADQVTAEPDTSRVHAVLSGPKELAGLVREIELLEIGKTDVVAKGVVRADGQLTGKFIIEGQPSQDDAETGVLKVVVLRGADPKSPMPGVRVEVVPADGGEAVQTDTDQRGVAELKGLTPGTKYVATVVASGTRISGEPTVMPEKGGAVSLVGVEWGQPIADIAGLPADPDKVYIIQARAGGLMHRSPPFQLSRSSGTIVPLPISPPPAFVFQIEGGIHDEFMTWSADIGMSNSPYVPYSFGEDVLIPLPKGFVGGEVQKPWDSRVKVLPGKGLLWKGAVPPGGFQFRAFFGTRVEDGATSFDLDLPYGATSSLIVFPHNDKTKVDVVGRAVGGPQKLKGREFYVLPNIEVAPQQRVVMRISGLPSPPGWTKWVKLVLGLVVLAVLLGAASTPFLRGRSGAARRAEEDARKQERLLGELTELERAHRAGEIPEGKYKKSKARLTKQLEPLYDRPST